jgi:hypothetical protein
MRETIARYRDLLAARLALLEEEVRLAEARYKEGHGEFRYVTLENVAVFEREVSSIRTVKNRLAAVDLEKFESVEEFKEAALAQLQELYDSRILLRAGIRMVMECLRDL